MIELVVTVCLAADPSRCREISLVYAAENLTPHQCMMASPLEIAKWSEGHPNWVAKRWTCRPSGRLAKI
jgi:hypothetical protein